ncbi:MAG TPA: nuclear transport factor 2 family protein [Daejeonella sp.]|nr:nuclear transport factor 2 family protein [Daejeonella sp.]
MFFSVAQAQTDKTKDKMQKADQAMPYKATYSSKFQIGDPKYAQIILKLWKDWDNNTLDQSAAMFADTVTMYYPDGTMLKGKEQNLAEAKKYRGQFTAVKSTIHAFVSLKSTDQNENWLAVWGTEEDTGQDGKITSTELHEVWRFNKDGRIDVMRQFQAKSPSAPMKE